MNMKIDPMTNNAVQTIITLCFVFLSALFFVIGHRMGMKYGKKKTTKSIKKIPFNFKGGFYNNIKQ